MKPDAIFHFSRIPGYETRYIQTGHRGKIIPEFPAVYKAGKHKGEKYIVFRRTSSYYKSGLFVFTHALELAKSRIVTGLIFLPEFPRQTYGTFKEYAVIVEFSEDFNNLEVLFFKEMREAAPILFQKKQAGEIPEITKADTLRLRYGIGS